MDMAHAVALAMLQGLTEFLPISSSAHLILVPVLVEWPDQGLAFDVAVRARHLGVGIDPQYHQKVFGLFERLDADSEGTGVGLALVKRIVEVHGGSIWVESEGLGRGATLRFRLPLSDGEDSAAAPGSA